MPVIATDGVHDPRNVGFRFRATCRDGRGHEQGDHEQSHAFQDSWEVRCWLPWGQSCGSLWSDTHGRGQPKMAAKTTSQGGANAMQALAAFHVWTPAKHPTSLALGSHPLLCGEWNLPFALSWRH